MAIANYDDLDTGLSLRFTSRNQQYSVASDNGLSGAESQWGYRLQQNNTVAGVSNISYDFGTDPRSIANAAWAYSPNNFYYHNYIYRWQMAHSSEPSYSQEVQEASTIMGSQLENYGEPLSVAINAGAHSVLVTGVYSNNEPLAFFPADITGITFRDPQDSSHWTVPFSTWVSGISGGYSLWSVYYGNGMRPLDGQDPEPQVGPYTPGSGQVHWFRGFNWISRDNNTSGVYWNPDWSYTAYPGTVMTTP